jgi:hypothetical protein
MRNQWKKFTAVRQRQPPGVGKVFKTADVYREEISACWLATEQCGVVAITQKTITVQLIIYYRPVIIVPHM